MLKALGHLSYDADAGLCGFDIVQLQYNLIKTSTYFTSQWYVVHSSFPRSKDKERRWEAIAEFRPWLDHLSRGSNGGDSRR